MARHQARPSIKHMLHEGATSGGDSGGAPHGVLIASRILPSLDVCINRENPNRKLPKNKVLVVGYAPSGHFDGCVPQGQTHGYWTQNIFPFIEPADGGGSTTQGYISRILMEFDVSASGITTSDILKDATIDFFFYKNKTIKSGESATLDFHRVHPGLTGSTADTQMTESATWWEYDFSNSATGATYNASTAIGTFALTNQDGPTIHGTNVWEFQGLGATGSTAEHIGDDIGGPTGWVDFSGGPAGSDIDSASDNLYTQGFVVQSTQTIPRRKTQLDIKDAVQDAITYYNGKLRFMIKLRDDELLSDTTKKFVSFYSKEAERDKASVFSVQRASSFSPAIHIEWLRP